MSADPFALSLPVPAEWLEAVAARAAQLVLEQQAANRGPAYLTADEAAEILRAKRKRVYDLHALGKLRCVRDGSRLLVPRSAIDEYLSGEGQPKGVRP